MVQVRISDEKEEDEDGDDEGENTMDIHPTDSVAVSGPSEVEGGKLAHLLSNRRPEANQVDGLRGRICLSVCTSKAMR